MSIEEAVDVLWDTVTRQGTAMEQYLPLVDRIKTAVNNQGQGLAKVESFLLGAVSRTPQTRTLPAQVHQFPSNVKALPSLAVRDDSEVDAEYEEDEEEAV